MDAILIGGFVEVIELCELCNIKITGIIDNNLTDNYCGYPILGKDADAPTLFKSYGATPVIITPDIPGIRAKLFSYYSTLGYSFLSLISPKAEISKSAVLGQGVVIQSGVNISSNSVIGDFTKLNTFANVMHDCRVGSFTTIAPNAVLLGRVTVESHCYIGSNSTILPEVTVHEHAIVGAGAVVVRDVARDITVKGVPAK